MNKQGRNFLRLMGMLLIPFYLTGCVGPLWTGATLVYDRHGVYKKVSDYQLFVEVNNALFYDNVLRGPGRALDLAIFNGDVLVVGHLPTRALYEEEKRRLSEVTGYRRLFNQVSVSDTPTTNAQDGWITTQIRSGIFADDTIDPNAFKVVTSDGIVYLMGDVKRNEAKKVTRLAQKTKGVVRVVTLMKYYTYQSK